ncbi:NADH-quinone oxidoreductase subunit N (plasmid) [Peptoclostridium acidaminophilum DSM 3953]|uniref:NADH-quinone oxidoreductase subunit N n=1 Tax=Peptoclostridium acidaminophilum DSM 3953 TaxID=1286171 RepID=W8TNU1_PEPAC|nr:proton-conducting transporter membrane subunit [Peptoclostridium acidaminophilum]AHM57827.1 NADH-quinone oxidoreductase subunit N [Peptoclostridium acidaminophilum DSM 3953]
MDMEYCKSFPVFALLMPLMISFAMPLIKSNRAIKKLSAASSGASMTLCALTLKYVVVHGAYKYKMGHFEAPLGIEFKVGPFEAIMALTFTVVTFLVVMNSLSRIEEEIGNRNVQIYFVLVNIFYASLVGMVFTNDIFNSFVFIEVSTLAACGMIAANGKGQSIVAAIKYLVYSSIGSGLVLMGMAFLYSVTGNLNIDFINSEMAAAWLEYENVVLISMALFVFGLGIKGAIFPLHVWMPDAYAFANHTSSALIAGIGAKAIVVLLVKVLYSMYGAGIVAQSGLLNVFVVLGVSGMIMGSIFAIFQSDIKRMLAYSSVAQMGYIFLGIGMGNVLGLAAAMFHAIGHSVTKASLFLSAANLTEAEGKERIDELEAVGGRRPVSLGIYTVGALSMAGIPLLPGFISKWNLSIASIEAGRNMVLAAIIISSLLNCIYYLPVAIKGYFKKNEVAGIGIELCRHDKAALGILPLALLSFAIIGIGILSGEIMDAFRLEFSKLM